MIRYFFQWRARKKLARNRYRIDRRIYHGRFRAGFLSHLQTAHFWETHKDPYARRLRWRRRVLWLFALALLAFISWAVLESIRAFALF